ncbi:MAG: hypothetical protein AAFQ40_04855 [Cyanobacteria bacterium J06623_5]
MLISGGVGLSAPAAIAQVSSSVSIMEFDPDTGFVQIDNNAFDIQTGEFDNTSNTPLPDGLPPGTREGDSLPVRTDILAPNSIEITPDFEYIERTFNTEISGDGSIGTYLLDEESLQLTSQFDLRYRVGSHDFGEGIQVNVLDEDGNSIDSQTVFVRGDSIQLGPDGELLPSENQIRTTFGVSETVELRVLNLRQDGAVPDESAIYFSEDGELIVEDLQDGGDLDFDDGDYVGLSGGEGEAAAILEEEVVETEEVTTETPLDPETREEEIVETDEITTIQEMDAVTETVTDFGEVEIPPTVSRSVRLGHATAARTPNGDVLVYDRYARAAQVRAGSDGLGLTGQLSPLVNNPSVPPTLLTGNVTFNPFVADNEAGLTATAGITQFITPTHRQARDLFGNPIDNPDGSNRRLVEPTGVFNNRKLVGYVPPTPEETVLGDPISSIGGIFDLPSDQPVVISPPNAEAVGRGNAAYTDNVGGLLIERADGELSFVPQWTADGYAQDELALEAGEAVRIIYALVPQQPGQSLQLGQRYAVTRDSRSYQIVDGGFTVISADRQPENFLEERSEVYAVEDTLASQTNAVTTEFNGIRGIYAEEVGGVRVPTLDVGLATEADARVGNTLYPLSSLPGDPGQQAYTETTRAAGFYLGGSLTGGIGNQQNTVIESGGSMEVAFDELRTRRTLNTFLTPLTQVDTVTVETTTVSEASGTAQFDINDRGELINAQFLESDRLVVDMSEREIDRQQSIIRGEETLVSSVTEESFEPISSEIIEFDQETTTREETEANFSPVQGELALGGVLNFGNTPWTAAANTLRAELFARDTVFGRSNDGSEVGWRAEAVFHPFGEVRRAAFQYDTAGNAVPVYQTEAAFDDSGERIVDTVSGPGGETVSIPVNRFVLDDSGDRIAQMVGTGSPVGPGMYLRVEDAFDDGEGVIVAGGLELSF